MFNSLSVIILIGYELIVLGQSTTIPTPSKVSRVNVIDLSTKYGHPATTHDVVTEDGYVLQIFNIPGEGKYPILLMHGLADTADTWLARGNASLAITLARSGYDVWLGNCRGNRYARSHMYLDPDEDTKFWNFSFHHHGIYDLAAIIDTILDRTGSSKLNAIGHSQGNTIFYVLGSMRPEYNAKINLLIALAPVCYLHNTEEPLSMLFRMSSKLNELFKHMGIYEFFGNEKLPGQLLKAICSVPYFGYTMCIENFLFKIAGADPNEFDRDIFKTTNVFFPSSTSRMNMNHFSQLYKTRRFGMYDYGTNGNKLRYNSSKAPQYDLKKVEMPIAFIVGLNDKISTVRDVDILRKQLPNLVNYTVSPRKTFNHIDDVWGRRMGVYLFPIIFNLLTNYS